MSLDLKSARGAAQRRFDEVCRLLLDGENSLCVLIANARREGLGQEKADAAWAELRRIIAEADLKAEALAAAPIVRISCKSRIAL